MKVINKWICTSSSRWFVENNNVICSEALRCPLISRSEFRSFQRLLSNKWSFSSICIAPVLSFGPFPQNPNAEILRSPRRSFKVYHEHPISCTLCTISSHHNDNSTAPHLNTYYGIHSLSLVILNQIHYYLYLKMKLQPSATCSSNHFSKNKVCSFLFFCGNFYCLL